MVYASYELPDLRYGCSRLDIIDLLDDKTSWVLGGGGEWVVGGGWGLGGGCGRGGLGAGVGGYEKIKTAIHKVVTANSGVA